MAIDVSVAASYLSISDLASGWLLAFIVTSTMNPIEVLPPMTDILVDFVLWGSFGRLSRSVYTTRTGATLLIGYE
jgi:hypothetical protein